MSANSFTIEVYYLILMNKNWYVVSKSTNLASIKPISCFYKYVFNILNKNAHTLVMKVQARLINPSEKM